MEGVEFVVYVDRCIKFNLPDGSTVDILTDVVRGMMVWIQEEDNQPESCGFILGYQNYDTRNITLSDITIPQIKDKRTRFFCKLVDSIHFDLLKKSKQKKNFYMGVWHTHPQNIPAPSVVDLNDWKDILKKDKITEDDYWNNITTMSKIEQNGRFTEQSNIVSAASLVCLVGAGLGILGNNLKRGK